MKYNFALFRREDFPGYKSWYEDADLNNRLGPINEEWLEHVLSANDERQYSVFRDQELVAVIGIICPKAGYPAYYITDFAIKPNLREQGIGSEVLHELMELHPLTLGQTWKAFVDTHNPRAKTFFEKNGWIDLSTEADEHGMLELEYKGKSSLY